MATTTRTWQAWLTLPHILLCLITLVTSGLAGRDVFANVTRSANPDSTLAIVPRDSVALSNAMDAKLTKGRRVPPSAIEGAARLSLRGQALNPQALRLLGYALEAEGGLQNSRALVRMSSRVSRRDFATRLWLIEDAVSRNALAEVIAHYDVALRTSPSGNPLLFPLLADALSEPEIRSNLVTVVRRDPLWLQPFLLYAIERNTNVEDVAKLAMTSGGLGSIRNGSNLESYLLAQLVRKQQFGVAKDYFLSLPGANPRLLRYASFDSANVAGRFSPFTWELENSPSIESSFSDGGEKGASLQMHVYVASGERGYAARKLIFLQPGQHRIVVQFEAGRTGSGDALAFWQVRCVGESQDRVVWQNGRNDFRMQGKMTAVVTVPNDCAAQFLELGGYGGSGQEGLEFTVLSLALE